MPDPHVPADLAGRIVVITGASSGIGAAAARQFTAAGATVVPIGRSVTRTAAIAAELGVEPLRADFARLDDVRRVADALLRRCPRIDVLANNAGALFPRREITVDGHETSLQVNHLAPFLLTTLLLPRLRDSAARVVTTSSLGNRFGRLRMDDLEWERRRYGGGWIAYSTTKLMNVLFTRELARRTGIWAACFNPGGVATNFAAGTRPARLLELGGLRRRLSISAADGARPLVWLAGAPDVTSYHGTYFDRFHPNAKVNPQADDPALAKLLWDRSADLTAMP